MDNEVSTSLSLTVQIMIVSVVVGILALFMVFSQNFGRSAISEIAQTQSNLYGAELRTVEEAGPIPVAALLAVLRKNESAVGNVQGAPYGVTVAKTDDLANVALLSRKVKAKADLAGDLYMVQIIEEEERFPDE